MSHTHLSMALVVRWQQASSTSWLAGPTSDPSYLTPALSPGTSFYPVRFIPALASRLNPSLNRAHGPPSLTLQDATGPLITVNCDEYNLACQTLCGRSQAESTASEYAKELELTIHLQLAPVPLRMILRRATFSRSGRYIFECHQQ